ncbi:MAG TPA: hypothetical protein VLN58_05090, partial [Verrucomicrobiae bacterium]|nr:hypothetical protein [Verrucomicrobiae bacterium]
RFKKLGVLVTNALSGNSRNALPHQEPWFEVWPRRKFTGLGSRYKHTSSHTSKTCFYNISGKERSMRTAGSGASIQQKTQVVPNENGHIGNCPV